MILTPEQFSVWSKEMRDRARAENRAFNKFHKAHRHMDREDARRAFDAGVYFAMSPQNKE